MRPGRLTARARTRGLALGAVAALVTGCNTADRMPDRPPAVSQLPRPTNVPAARRPVPQRERGDSLAGQAPPSAAQLQAREQPNQPAALSPHTILKNDSSFGTVAAPAAKPPVEPVSAAPTGLIMPQLSITPAGRTPAPIESLPGLAEPPAVPPPTGNFSSPDLPPAR